MSMIYTKFRSLMFFINLIVLGVVLTACSDNNEKKALNVSALNNYPPLVFKADGQLTGFEYDILVAIAKEEDLVFEFKEMKFDGFIPGLQSGQIDIASSLVIKEARKEVVDFADPFMTSGLVLVVAADSAIANYDDLKGKTIVATQGATTYEMAKELAEKYGATAKPLKETDVLYLDVENGNSDALVLNSPTVQYRLSVDGENTKFKIIDGLLTEDEHAFAVKKGNKALIDKLNSGLQKIKESGEFDTLYTKWFQG